MNEFPSLFRCFFLTCSSWLQGRGEQTSAEQDTPFPLISGDTGSVDYFWHPQPVNKNSNSTVEESQKSAVS